MIAIVLLGLLACASAAPRRSYHHHYAPTHYEDYISTDNYLDRYIESQMSDTRRFWNDLSREMMRLDTMLADLSKRYPSNEPSVQIDDKEYKITLRLQGFDEKEIIVKAKKGLYVVQAVREVAGEPESNYLYTRMLPDNVGENGRWTYENGLLKIVFPILEKDIIEKEIPTPTRAPDYKGEETQNNEEHNDQIYKIDERIGYMDHTNGKDLETNEIPLQKSTKEATTYDVSLNSDVELLPLRRHF